MNLDYPHALRIGLMTIAMTLLPISNGLAGDDDHICRYHGDAHRYAPDKDNASDAPNPRQFAPDRLVDVRHIKIDVVPDFKARTVTGTTTITFVPVGKALSEWQLDAQNLTITAVRSEAKIADHDSTAHDLTILFDPPVPAGKEVSVAIDHHAQPRRGLYFRTPEMGYPKGDTHLWTQGETHEARHWFPCYDYPNERSSTEVVCHVPADMTVVSNGRLVSQKVDPKTGLKAVRWLQEKPHVVYLVALVAGYLEKIEAKHGEVPLRFYTPRSLIKHASNSFRETADIMAFFEKEIGVPFPWEKYDQAAVHDFRAGGMENTTLTILTTRTLFTDATENIDSSRRLNAHEMAHQWFGDYVTCKDWSHLWLNEGFATYYTHLYEGHHTGPDGKLYGLWRDAKTRVLPRGKDDPRPIVYRQYKSPGEQFDYRNYPKGSWVLHMLRSRLGENLYRRCIKTFLERHALTSVVTEDLNSVIEDLSGQSFDPFFDQWVYHAGHPELKITYRWLAGKKLAKVTVEQTQKGSNQVAAFSFPTKLRFVIKGSGQVVDHDVEIEERKHDFFVPLPAKPQIVRFDPDYTVLANVNFKKPDHMLFAQLANHADMVGRLLAARDLGKRKTHASVSHLKKALQHDPFYGVRMAAASALAKIHDDEAFAALAKSLDDPDARVRQQVVEDLGRFYRPRTLPLLKQVITKEKNPAIQATAITALGRFDTKASRELLLKYLKSKSFDNLLEGAAIDAIEMQRDASFSDAMMKTLAKNERDFKARYFGNALGVLATINRDEDDRADVRRFITGYLDHPRRRIAQDAAEALGMLGDPQALAVLETLAGDERTDPTDRMATAAREALEALQNDAPLAPAEVSELRKTVTQLKKDNDELRKDVDELTAQLKNMQP